MKDKIESLPEALKDPKCLLETAAPIAIVAGNSKLTLKRTS